jgi:hypothetical protein
MIKTLYGIYCKKCVFFILVSLGFRRGLVQVCSICHFDKEASEMKCTPIKKFYILWVIFDFPNSDTSVADPKLFIPNTDRIKPKIMNPDPNPQ